MNDRLLRTRDRFIGAVDERLARLGQDLDGHIIRDQVFFDQGSHKVEIRLTGAREPDLNLLVPHAYEKVEHDALALRAHRVDECLVSIAEVNGAPHRSSGDALGRPGAVGQVDSELFVVRAVLVRRHCRRLLSVFHQVFTSSSLRSLSLDGQPMANSATREACLGLVAAAKKEQTAEHGLRLPPVGRRVENSGLS